MKQKELKKKKKKACKSKIVYKGYNKTYNFRKFKTIHASNEIRNNIINMCTENEQNYLAKYIE